MKPVLSNYRNKDHGGKKGTKKKKTENKNSDLREKKDKQGQDYEMIINHNNKC